MSKRRRGDKSCRRSLFKSVIKALVNVNDNAIFKISRKIFYLNNGNFY
jgi:hypothetical protein